jgi:hypothetical protein
MAATDTPVGSVANAGRQSLLRVGIAMGLTAIVLLVALNVGMSSVVALMFGGLPVLIIAPGIAVVLISVVLSACTGRRSIRAAIAVSVVAFVALGIALGTVPMIWVQSGFELVHLLIAIPSPLTLGLFLGPWRSRIAGLIGTALLITVAVWVSAPDPQPTGPSQAEQQEHANFEAFIESGAFPMVADLPGGTIVGVVPDGGPSRTLSVTADGGVVEVVIDRNPIATNPDIAPCWYLSAADMGLEDSDTIQNYASWCVQGHDLWRLTDGTGYARMENGSLIAVKSATSENVQAGGGERSANAGEVLEAWDSLRVMTEVEVRKQLQNG